MIGLALATLLASGIAYEGYKLYDNHQKNEVNKVLNLQHRLQDYAGAENTKEFEAYLRDSMFMGYIDGNTYKESLATYNKLRNNNYDFTELSGKERKIITTLYNELYENDANFKSQWDKKYAQMSDDEKLAFLSGGGSMGMAVPAPAYLDTSFDRYQKEVEPLKHYTNKELAELYNIDYDFDSIKRDYDAAAEAQVKYTTWLSDLLANNAERNNTTDTTSYLDAIRNIKSEAIQKGMSNGARAAADLLATTDAIKNKVTNNTDVATQRFEAMNDSLLNRAQTELTTLGIYNDLAKSLSNTGNQLYANDINRLGQDLLSNANFLSADENLRSNRMAQNNLMAAMYNAAAAQNAGYKAQADNALNYFRDISLPANDNNFRQALSDYIGLGYAQDTGYTDPMNKWGSVYLQQK